MSTRRTWVWVLVAVIAGALVCLMTVAGASIYFVSKRVHAEPATAHEALQSFEHVTAPFLGRPPLYEIGVSSHPKLTAPLASLPTASTAATDLWVQAWDPNEGRLVTLSLPLWLLRFGDHKMRVLRDEGGVALRELSLDVDELGRIGPSIVLDYRRASGVRILLWTQ